MYCIFKCKSAPLVVLVEIGWKCPSIHIEEICHEVYYVKRKVLKVKGQYSILLYSDLTTDPTANLRSPNFP